MDQQTLFYVSALTREMIAVCYNNFEMDEEKGADEHIRQFFCLTHNPVFFRDITYNRCKNRSNPSTCTEKSCHLIGIILPPRRRCLPPISVFFITEALHTVPVPAQMASGTVRRQPHGKRLASVKGSS